eukprot:2997328-Prymnesium_polylepis.1
MSNSLNTTLVSTRRTLPGRRAEAIVPSPPRDPSPPTPLRPQASQAEVADVWRTLHTCFAQKDMYRSISHSLGPIFVILPSTRSLCTRQCQPRLRCLPTLGA